MTINAKHINIIQSFKNLKGNTRTIVMFEPMWGIPFVLFNFYLSLYMKSQGVTDRQIGYLISIGFICSSVFSLLGGIITDTLGRRRTTTIFDFISWPLSVLIYIFSNSFWMFAIATITNSATKIVQVSFNLMVVEDADREQRIGAYNLINIINTATGVITPLGGLLVAAIGIVKAEKSFLIFAFISMSLMMLLRHRAYAETKIGMEILKNHKGRSFKSIFRRGLYGKAFEVLQREPKTILIICVVILFNMFVPIGSFISLYFAPYMNEVVGIEKSMLSILGSVYSGVMLVVLGLINPIISRFNMCLNLIAGLLIQIFAMCMIILIPYSGFVMALISIGLSSAGYGIFKPYMDSLLADVTEGNERAGIYSLINTITSVVSAVIGAVSGYLYVINPRLIYIVSIIILGACSLLLIAFMRLGNGNAVSDNGLSS